jgi:hypothetical protein
MTMSHESQQLSSIQHRGSAPPKYPKKQKAASEIIPFMGIANRLPLAPSQAGRRSCRVVVDKSEPSRSQTSRPRAPIADLPTCQPAPTRRTTAPTYGAD